MSPFFYEVKTRLPAQKGTIDTLYINYTRTFPKCLIRNKNKQFPCARKLHQMNLVSVIVGTIKNAFVGKGRIIVCQRYATCPTVLAGEKLRQTVCNTTQQTIKSCLYTISKKNCLAFNRYHPTLARPKPPLRMKQ